MKNFKIKKQDGFSILAVILVIVAVIVAIGVWALSGQTNTSNSSNSSADIQASSIVNDAGSIKLAFDTLIINGTSAANIIFKPNFSDPNNMLDPTTGIQAPKPNSNAIKATPSSIEGFWVYNGTGVTGDTVGTSAVDQTILLAGIKDSVCQRINNTLYGATTIPTFILSGITTGATVNLPTSSVTLALNGLTPTGSAVGWTSGCFSTGTADSNVYFRILKSN